MPRNFEKGGIIMKKIEEIKNIINKRFRKSLAIGAIATSLALTPAVDKLNFDTNAVHADAKAKKKGKKFKITVKRKGKNKKTRTYKSGKLVFGKLIEGIEVLAVKDRDGSHIFKKSADQKDASALIFSVPEDLHILLRQATYINGAELIPVPRNADYNPTTNVKSDYLKSLIKEQAKDIPSDTE